MGIAIAAGIVGAGLLAGGTASSMNAAGKARKEMKDVANTPGLDFGMITRDALAGYNSNYGGAYDLSSRLSQDQQRILSAQEEQALPGIGAARGEALTRARGLFADSSQYIKDVQRRAGSLGVMRGIGGSGANQFGLLREDTQSANQRYQLGTNILSSLISGMKLTNGPAISAFLGTPISDQVAIRANERTQKMGYQAQKAQMSSEGGIMGGAMQQTGGILLGGAMMGMGGGGGGMMGGGGGGGGGYGGGGGGFTVGNYVQASNMARESGGYY